MRPLALGTVLVATDLGPSSDAALESGQRLAEAAGAALHVMHVEETAQPARDVARSRTSPAEDLARALRRAGVPEKAAKTHLVPGPAADAIRAIADVVVADVIIVGPHRHGARAGHAHALGGTARAVVLQASAPCLVAARPLQVPLERVLVPVDLSDTARGALLVALSWASALRAGSADEERTALTALHVADGTRGGGARQSPALADELESLRRDAGSWAGVRVEAVTTTEGRDVAKAIADVARERRADLVVLGTRGLGLDEVSRLGSVSASVIEVAPAPMLLVPPSVWRSHAARH